MALKELINIETKKKLFELYAGYDGWTVELLRMEINDIIRHMRKLPVDKTPTCKNLRFSEVIYFIEKHGEPRGYTLSEELEAKIDKLRQSRTKTYKFRDLNKE